MNNHRSETGREFQTEICGDNRLKREYKKTTWMVGLTLSVLFIGSAFLLAFAGARNIFPKFEKNVDPQISNSRVLFEDSAIIDVASKSSPAVVSIMISKDVATQSSAGYFDQLFGAPFDGSDGLDVRSDSGNTQKQVIGNGSGFLITTDGLILTNKHVIEDQQAEYSVVMEDGKKYAVEILARDPVRDVAIIKIEGTPPAGGFSVLPLGDSDRLKIGQTVIAIGDSLGEFSNSVSRGIVSGLKRNVNAVSSFGDTERLTDIIQTDAAINLGNSGGPLLDIGGNVIGINIAKAQGAENIGFALPINQVKRLIDQVERGIKISVPYLGVRYIVIDPMVKAQLKLPLDYGALITRGESLTDLAVIPGSPADLAGIVENDIILEINGSKITKDSQLGDLVTKFNVGDNITLKIWHRGQIRDIAVTLQELK
ncbi:MAG: 2-alkenal reductase [uncultured bacterium]|nr:MAG: 2-alkenal reductase [uncultured bacterium]